MGLIKDGSLTGFRFSNRNLHTHLGKPMFANFILRNRLVKSLLISVKHFLVCVTYKIPTQQYNQRNPWGCRGSFKTHKTKERPPAGQKYCFLTKQTQVPFITTI